MATLLDMRTEVQDYLGNRSDATDAKVDAAINEALGEHALSFRFYDLQVSTTFSTVIGTDFYTLTPEFLDIEDITPATTRTPNLIKVEDKWIREQSIQNSTPTHFARRGKQGILLHPVPDAVASYNIWYIKRPAVLALTTDVPEIPQEWHKCLVLAAASKMAFKLSLDEKGRNLKSEWLALISGLQEQATKDARGRFGQINVERGRPIDLLTTDPHV